MKKIEYLNTDLDLKSPTQFDELNNFLNKGDTHSLHYEKIKENQCIGTYETNKNYDSPNKTIKKLLNKLSKMNKICRKQWNKCSIKEVNIGYDCGKKPWAFNNEIESNILKDLAKLDIGIRITIYPEKST